MKNIFNLSYRLLTFYTRKNENGYVPFWAKETINNYRRQKGLLK